MSVVFSRAKPKEGEVRKQARNEELPNLPILLYSVSEALNPPVAVQCPNGG